MLSHRFIARIRDLPSKRLYRFDPAAAPKELRGLIGGKVREKLIVENWPDILRAAATVAAGVMPPGQLLRKFASYPRQHEPAMALREIGRIKRTLFIIDWLLDADMQRRAQIGLTRAFTSQPMTRLAGTRTLIRMVFRISPAQARPGPRHRPQGPGPRFSGAGYNSRA